MCMNICFYVCISTIEGQKRVLGPLKSELELPGGRWQLNLDPVQEQQVL